MMTWIVLGASSSVARAFARALAERGDGVILAGRDESDLEATAADCRVRGAPLAETVFFDAFDRASHRAIARRAERAARDGPLGVLLAFGSMPEQEAMETDPDLALACIDATYCGAVSILLRLAPVLAAARSGKLIVMGSVAGDRGRLKNHIYGSAKAGLAVFTAGLRNRLGRCGVSVTTVKPGFLDTAMTWGLPGIFLAASPSAAARAMLSAADKGRDEIYFPFFWRAIMTIIRHIPEKIFKRLAI